MLLCTFQLNKSFTRNWKKLKTAILDYLIYFYLKADTILNMLKCWCPCNNQDGSSNFICKYLHILIQTNAQAIQPNCYSINAELVKPNTTTTLIQYLMEPKNDPTKDN